MKIELDFRYRLALAAAAGSLVVALVALQVSPLIGVGAAYPFRAALIFALVMGLAAAASRGHSAPSLGPANLVTTIRAMGVALVTACSGEPASVTLAWALVGTSSVIVALDGLDGWLARRTRMTSAFGARFDMETDALLVFVLSVLVWQYGKAGAWIIAGGAMRYAFVAAGAVWPWMARPLGSTIRGKTIAVVFVAGVIVALAPIIPQPASAVVAASALVALTWSFSVDIRRLYHGRALEE